MTDDSRLTHGLALFICFTYSDLFQNGAKDMSKMVIMVYDFLSTKSSKFCEFLIIRFCLSFTSLWINILLKKYK